MNRTGLIIALAIGVVVGLVFGIFPSLDLCIAGFFYVPEKKDFILRWTPWAMFARDAAMWIVTVIVAPAFIALAIKLVFPRRRILIPSRAVLFMIATIAIAPGLVTNVILKDYWPRSRPIDVPRFNGEERFTAWWDPRGGCAKNCSFVSGEPSGAFWTLAPAALAPPSWRPLAYAAALTFGASVGLLRMAFGAHFLSDVVFSGVLTFLIIWVAYGLIYRWRRTKLSDEALERWIEHVALAPRRFFGSLFSGRARRERP